ncbi:MAG: DUF2877 domain-containing protein [Burkholderiales bacterium]|nr:DUF2877 domain-containing protein [Burkholderiales bacterium]
MTAAARTIGWKAHAALSRAAGRFVTLPGFADSAFRLAAGEPIWIGETSAAMHPRVVIADAATRRAGSLPIARVTPWREPALRLDPRSLAALRGSSIALAVRLRDLGDVRGFAAVLVGERPPFPLHAVAPQVAAVAEAIDRDDAQTLHDAALPLLGLGPGLTPSGDDFVGAVLYARALAPMDGAWVAARHDLVAAASRRTHAIGAALFADLAAGESFAALNRLAHALAHPPAAGANERDGARAGGAWAPAHQVREAARDVVAIGHSSGWDMLAGVIIGCAGGQALRFAADIHREKRCA